MDECGFTTDYNKKALQNQYSMCICEEILFFPRKCLTEESFKYRDDVIVTSQNFELSRWTSNSKHRAVSQSKSLLRQETRRTRSNDKFKNFFDHKAFMEDYRSQHVKTFLDKSTGDTDCELTLGGNVPDPYVFRTAYFRNLCKQVLQEFQNTKRDDKTRSMTLTDNTSLNRSCHTMSSPPTFGLRNNVTTPQINAVEQLCANMDLLARGISKGGFQNHHPRKRRAGPMKNISLPHLTKATASARFISSRLRDRDRLFTAKSAPGSLSTAKRTSNNNRSRPNNNPDSKIGVSCFYRINTEEGNRRIRKKKMENDNRLVNRPVSCGNEITSEESRLHHIQLTGKSGKKRKKISLKSFEAIQSYDSRK